ncbi:hypothetical protein TrRE_jg9164 [Triparma retinervis]|uniref:Uncharacterized protein n=1 Tax=Triparma retinervis TaxID=2557542 RepID=A0A9W7DZI1_9STRA|nr:hypothetical protein TrRE_jg9164 [Triparma retinervis]
MNAKKKKKMKMWLEKKWGGTRKRKEKNGGVESESSSKKQGALKSLKRKNVRFIDTDDEALPEETEEAKQAKLHAKSQPPPRNKARATIAV